MVISTLQSLFSGIVQHNQFFFDNLGPPTYRFQSIFIIYVLNTICVSSAQYMGNLL